MKYRCSRCKSSRVIIVAEVPRSTDGLIPKQKIYLKCEECGFVIPLIKKI